MSTEDKIKEIISFLKFETTYDKIFDSYLDEIYSYMKDNIESPLTIEFVEQYYKSIDDIYNQIKELDDVLKGNIIKNKDFKEAFIKSHIPFKCDEQYFFYKMYKVIHNDYKEDETFDSIICDLNNYIFNNSFNIKELLTNMGDLSTYDVKQNKNFYEKNNIKFVLMKQIQNGNIIIGNPRSLSDYEMDAVGYRGELHFNSNYKPQDGRLLVWNSQNVDGYSKFDFLEYDYKDDFLFPHEIKTTVTNDALNIATISEKEFFYLCDTLDQKNVIYFLHRYQFTPDLNTLRDSARFEIRNKRDVEGYNSNDQKMGYFELKCHEKQPENYHSFYTKLPIDIPVKQGFDEVRELLLKKYRAN